MIFDPMWLVTLASLIGVVANIKKKRWCFAVWLCTNTIWCVYDFALGLYPQAALFFIYVLLAVYGLWEWRSK
jgi:nicotinamide riboside transporter PnuC